VSFKDADELAELCKKVDQWTASTHELLQMPIEYHQRHLEKFKNCINDARILKLSEKMTVQV
jgi:hypothetical protein